MSRRKLPGRAARNALPESSKGSRTQPNRQRARKSRKFTYAEDSDLSSGSNSTESDHESDSDERSLHSHQDSTTENLSVRSRSIGPPKRPKPNQLRTTRSRAFTAAERSRNSPKRRKLDQAIGRPRRANTRIKDSHVPTVYPPWPTGLPYDVLLSIFKFAAYPLWDEHFLPSPSRSWLVKAALLRKEFTEPALAALYCSPPLYPPTNAQMMIDRLRAQTSSIDYRTKVKYLDIYVSGTLLKKYDGHPPINVQDLVSVTPQLRGIRFHHIADDPRLKLELEGRIETTKLKAIYSNELYDVIDSAGCVLRAWKWNYSRVAFTEAPWQSLSLIHSRPSFQRLKSLELCHFETAIGHSRSKLVDHESSTAQGLGMLSELESLTLSRSSLYGGMSVFDHVRPLKRFTLIDCINICSEDIADYLKDHGHLLEELTLLNNAEVNLDFISNLAISCPSLQSLEVDMTFYSGTLTTSVQSPLFNVLLAESCTPKWPRRLRRISMLQLRKWGVKSAEPFFASLQHAGLGGELPDLRTLIIKASLEDDWRDRIKFRDKWVDSLTKVFMRRNIAPQRHLAAEAETAAAVAPEAMARKEARSKLRSRGSSPPEEIEQENQGTCSTVDIRIDNLRPMDVQYNESNFMDDERSGDEDWDGQNGGDSNTYAW